MRRKILFEGTFPTTTEILLDILRDFWIDHAMSLGGSAIGGYTDEHFSRIYQKIDVFGFGTIAHIDIRRLNNDLVKIKILGTENNISYEGKLWDEISCKTDQILLDFVAHLKILFSNIKEVEQIANLGGEAGPAQIDAANGSVSLPSNIKNEKIDSLNFGKSCKNLYRDFSEDIAREILRQIPDARQDYQSELPSGSWGPRWVAKKLHRDEGTVSNHLRVMYKLGARSVDKIKLPYHPKNSTK